MIHLSDTLHFDPTQIHQKEINFRRFTFRIEILLVLLFLFATGCAQPSAQQQANAVGAQSDEYSDDSFDANVGSSEVSAEAQSCGRQTYPRYVDTDNQIYVQNEIESGSAHLILHFKVNCDGVDKQTCDSLGQQAISSFLERTDGVLEVGYQWPDWAAASLVVNERGLNQLAKDCQIRVIEADRREYPL